MSDTPISELDNFARLVNALEPWLSEVVIVGGWAHRLFRYHPEARRVGYEPLITLDTDIALPPNLTVKDEDLRSRLAAAGFKETFLGDEQPRAAHYQLGDEDGSFYAEFLSPLLGSEYDREGNRRATSEVAGVTSQQLRYLDLLLAAPWTIELSRSNGFPLVRPINIRIANPAHFMAQKLLIHKRRDRRSRAKDILYLHDTIELFGASIGTLNREWNITGRVLLHENAISAVESAADTLFDAVTDDARGAARTAAGRELSGEDIQQLCQAGLNIVFRKR